MTIDWTTWDKIEPSFMTEHELHVAELLAHEAINRAQRQLAKIINAKARTSSTSGTAQYPRHIQFAESFGSF